MLVLYQEKDFLCEISICDTKFKRLENVAVKYKEKLFVRILLSVIILAANTYHTKI